MDRTFAVAIGGAAGQGSIDDCSIEPVEQAGSGALKFRVGHEGFENHVG